MGGWAVAQNLILGTTITLERLYKRGYEPMQKYYEKVALFREESVHGHCLHRNKSSKTW